jgi:hypothetical protein
MKRISIHAMIPRLEQLNAELLNKAQTIEQACWPTPTAEQAQAVENLREAARVIRAAEGALRVDEMRDRHRGSP